LPNRPIHFVPGRSKPAYGLGEELRQRGKRQGQVSSQKATANSPGLQAGDGSQMHTIFERTFSFSSVVLIIQETGMPLLQAKIIDNRFLLNFNGCNNSIHQVCANVITCYRSNQQDSKSQDHQSTSEHFDIILGRWDWWKHP